MDCSTDTSLLALLQALVIKIMDIKIPTLIFEKEKLNLIFEHKPKQ